MRVTWDSRKAAANLEKHKASEEASTALADPLVVTGVDPDHSGDEARWVTFGVSNRQRLLAIAHTKEDDDIRIISARTATRSERRLDEEG
jgi:uncharacterized protein